jgi:teichuronic acid biosynthesis glycosyltransferase TuaG
MTAMNIDSSNLEAKILSKNAGKEVCKTSPTFSVIMPVYNLAALITETLDSIFNQTFTDYEVILVNDGSSDSPVLEELLKSYQEKLIYIKQENAGAAIARNTAILHARGKYLAFLDGDDVWFPEYLEKQLEFIEQSGNELIYCDAEFFGEKVYKQTTYFEQTQSFGEVSTENLFLGNANVITSGTVVLREKLLEYGLFDNNFHRNEDYDMWFRLVKNGVKAGYQTEVLLKYRIRLGSLSGNNVQRAERLLHAYRLIGKKYDLNESELQVLEKQLKIAEAALSLEKGKNCLISDEFEEAKTHFSKANEYYKKPKLKIIIWLVRLSPRIIKTIFKQLRKREYALTSAKGS